MLVSVNELLQRQEVRTSTGNVGLLARTGKGRGPRVCTECVHVMIQVTYRNMEIVQSYGQQRVFHYLLM